MGISGLLPLLREAQRKGHVKEFSGQTVGVDSYIWLYKGAFSCAADLALGTPTTKYVSFFMERAHMLRHYGIEPLFVFDGGPLPSKRATELERQRNRTERRTQATKLWNQAKRKAAFELFQKCVEATPAMAKAVIEELKKHGFRYIVAPYEADAQLAFLESQGVISAAISEDSDLIVFGCSNIIFKLDKFGAASIFDRSRMHRARAVDIAGWDNRRLRQMCILSGCDYAASVAGVGLKKAYSYTLRSTDIASAVRLMRADGLDVPDGYEGDAVRADLTFLYQRVYDPHAKALAHVTSLCDDAPAIEDMPFIGDDLEPDVAHAIAMGDIDPFSYLPFGQHVGPVVAAPSNVLAESPTKKAGSRTPSSTTAASRSKSLLSFWAKPGAKASRAKGQLQLVQAKSASSATSAVANEAAQCPAVIAVEDEEDEEDEVLIVMTRSRRAAKDSNVVSTGQRSRFFGNPNTTPESSKTEPARTLEWPETPAQLHAYSIDSQETIVQPLSATQTSGFDEVVSSTATTQPLSQSSTVCTIDLTSTFLGPLQANSAAQKEDLQPEGRKRAYYLLDQAQHKPSGVSEWAAAPVYKKGNYGL
ncbi:hypothetical protein GGI26_002361 [Coemansia sp. RSA 1358]|nr:hypothetical protein GGI26_002361 [Coemansia sp. RSA 1358]